MLAKHPFNMYIDSVSVYETCHIFHYKALCTRWGPRLEQLY